MAPTLDKLELLRRLSPVEAEEEADLLEEEFRTVSLASAMLFLAELDHEHEYRLCRSVAQHLLGEVPEPEDSGLGD